MAIGNLAKNGILVNFSIPKWKFFKLTRLFIVLVSGPLSFSSESLFYGNERKYFTHIPHSDWVVSHLWVEDDQILYMRSLKIIQEYHRAKPRHRWGTSTLFFLPKFIILVANSNLFPNAIFLHVTKNVSVPFCFCHT